MAVSRSTPRSSERADSGHANFTGFRIQTESRRAKPLPCLPEGLFGRAQSLPVSCSNRLIVRWRGHCCPERDIAGQTLQYALCRNDLALRDALNQLV